MSVVDFSKRSKTSISYSFSSSLHTQIKLARAWLPLSITGIVILNQLVIVPIGDSTWEWLWPVLFYGILGPLVTFATLTWIGLQVQERESAELELRRLYDELQSSHALLSTIQKVTESFASATDLETVLSAAGKGLSEATGAKGSAVLIGSSNLGLRRSYNLSAVMAQDAAERNRSLLQGQTIQDNLEDDDNYYSVLSAPLIWGGKAEGSVHAYYDEPPRANQRESFFILGSEFSAATEAARSRTRDLLTLVEIDRSIRAEGNLEYLLETLLKHMLERAEASIGGVYLLEEGVLQLKSSQGLGNPPSVQAIRLSEGFIGKAAMQSEPCIASQLAESDKVSVLLGAQSALSLTLQVENEALGLVVMGHPKKGHFQEAILPVLDLLAGQVSLAVRNARAYLQSEELAIAEERARIASEIHDGVAQTLAFSALKLDLVIRLLDKPDKAQQELELTKSAIKESIKEVRRSIFALRPVDLERYGFVDTIRRYCHDFGQQNDVQTDLDIQEVPQLSAKSEAILFRIFQESMHNVAKHSKASQVRVASGTTTDNCAYIEVEDNGLGFDIEEVGDRVTSAGGIGLKQMRERVESRRGIFDIQSHVGQGTRIYACVPE